MSAPIRKHPKTKYKACTGCGKTATAYWDEWRESGKPMKQVGTHWARHRKTCTRNSSNHHLIFPTVSASEAVDFVPGTPDQEWRNNLEDEERQKAREEIKEEKASADRRKVLEEIKESARKVQESADQALAADAKEDPKPKCDKCRGEGPASHPDCPWCSEDEKSACGCCEHCSHWYDRARGTKVFAAEAVWQVILFNL